MKLIFKFSFPVKSLAIDSSITEVKLPKDASENRDPKTTML